MANPDKKIRYLPFLLIAVTLVLFGCLGQETDANTTNITNSTDIKNVTNVTDTTNVTNVTNVTETPKVVECENKTSGKEDCLIARAIENQNLGDCRSLTSVYYEKCIYGLANLSFAYCGQLTSESSIDDCFLEVSPRFNLEVCDSILNSTKKDECKLGFVIGSCKSISNETERLICDSIERSDKDLCDRTSDVNLCYLRYSKNKNESSTCDKITIQSTKFACLGLLDSGQACNSIDPGVVRDSCYKTYAIEKPDCSFCENIRDSVYRSNCFGECASVSGDSTQCAKPEEEIDRDICYKGFALATDNEKICSNIKFLALRRLCVEQVAIKTTSPNKCDSIGKMVVYGQGEISACYYNVIGIVEIPAVNCLLMNASLARDQCIFTDVKRTRDGTTCTSIGEEALRTVCLELK